MITWESICKAVEPMKTIGIERKDNKTGKVTTKEYATVPERVKAFRQICPGGSIATEIVTLTDNMVVMKSTVADEDGKVLSTGMAFERPDSSYINKTSFIENCETSAVGRALGWLALGVDASMASAEELANAITQQQDIKRREQEPVEPKAAPVKSATVSNPTNFQIAMEWCNTVGITLDSFKNYVQAAIKNGAVPNKKVNDMTDDEFNELLKWVSANAS